MGQQYNQTFDLKLGNLVQTGNCAYISHDGNTGDIAVNSPANGDIVALNTGKKPLHTKVFPKPSKTIKSKGHLCGGAIPC